MPPSARTTTEFILTDFGQAVALFCGALLALSNSPKPMAWLVRRHFTIGPGIEPFRPEIYRKLSQRVRVEKDVEYPSRFKSNRLDVFSPMDSPGPHTTILWMHGGGFVGGDKVGVETWATLIAAEGYTVVSINYERAPESQYPGPVIQLGEVYEFLSLNEKRFGAVDRHRLILGGDSAGAQIASQFTALQTNPALAVSMELSASVPAADLIGVILYCGPYDLRGLYDTDNRVGRFLVRQLGWAYFGIRDWRDTAQAAQASTVEHVTSDYPMAFLTDGNTGSFEADARKLEVELKGIGVYVDLLLYPLEQGSVGHEYQFDFSTPESLQVYYRTLAFLAQVTASG